MLPLLCIAAAAGSGCDQLAGTGGGAGLFGEAAPGPPRTFAPRLSIRTEYRACLERVAGDGAIPRSECEPASRGTAGAALSRAQTAGEPEVLHATALEDLRWAEGTGILLDRSILNLRRAALLSRRPAPVLADLAAAHLVRAERAQDTRDLLEAVEVARQALRADSGNVAAAFNLGLALDRLALDGEARLAWGEYLELDPASGWAEEARRRLRESEPPPAARPPGPGATRVQVAEYAAGAPQEAQLLGWDRLLGEWGEAVLAGDAGRAADALRLAGMLGTALERRGGDATLGDAVRTIHAGSGDAEALRALAGAHRAYVAGRAAYASGDYPAAAAWLEQAAAPGASLPLRLWAGAFRAASLSYASAGSDSRPEVMLRGVLGSADPVRHPSLAARARWMLGTIALRGGRFEEALGHYRQAEPLYARAGERENLGAVRYLVAETSFKAGDLTGGYAAMQRALATLRPYRGSVWLHNLLYASAKAAEADGFVHAALAIQDEGVAVAARTGKAKFLAEAHLVRAQRRLAAGLPDRAAEDIAAGRALLGALRSGNQAAWFEADLRTAEAGAQLHRDPVRAAAALDSVVAFFGTGASAPRLLEALVKRSEARLLLGDLGAAAGDLDRVVALVDRQRALTASDSLRVSQIDAARRVFDRMVMLQVRAGRPAEALRYLERGRSSLGRGGRRGAEARVPVPARHVVVDYALIGDTLLAWTVAGSSVQLSRSLPGRQRLLQLVERTRQSLELGEPEAATAPALRELHDLLVRPVETRLGGEDAPVTVVADGELADVPFPALLDARGRYLVERHPLRVAGSLRDAGRRRAPRGPPGSVLLVADPAFDRGAHPGLEPLRGAAAEVEAISALYRGASVLEGAAADSAAVESGMREAEVVHYAGHAVFLPVRPERSFLVLAPPRGAAGDGRLTAASIERFDLRHLRLVVLSACQTLRGRSTRWGGFAGVSGALLASGAGGVVGSLWRVDDTRTQRLMVEFHREYRVSGDGAVALREAQLRLLRSGDPGLRTPAAWAGFRYVGD